VARAPAAPSRTSSATRCCPIYAAKAGGFFFIVFGVVALMGALSINPVWKYGPYDPSKVTAGSQPDWYMGWPDGALRIMPGWETHIFGVTISWNVMLPILILPVVMFLLLLLPFIEAWITGDKRTTTSSSGRATPHPHGRHGGADDDVRACSGQPAATTSSPIRLHLSINQITYFMRVAVFVGPVIAFLITKRWCISLQRHDARCCCTATSPASSCARRGRLHRAAPADQARTARTRSPHASADEVFTPGSGVDEHGVAAKGGIGRGSTTSAPSCRRRCSPTTSRSRPGRARGRRGTTPSTSTSLQAGLDHPAPGHEFDDHSLRTAGDVPLRGAHDETAGAGTGSVAAAVITTTRTTSPAVADERHRRPPHRSGWGPSVREGRRVGPGRSGRR
jgi:ubiquinol-cytochrome c reductase cytochrome b subunit